MYFWNKEKKFYFLLVKCIFVKEEETGKNHINNQNNQNLYKISITQENIVKSCVDHLKKRKI